MNDPLDRRWKPLRIGLDEAVSARVDDAVMTFGCGPPAVLHRPTERLEALLEDSSGPVAVNHCRQVHGRIVHTADDATAGVVEIGEGDGIVTARRRVGLLVWTADCVPILVAGVGVVAAIHSGWRGCAADIVGAAVERLMVDYNQSLDDLRFALGPAICGACYQVGDEVLDALQGFCLGETGWITGDRVDLRGFLCARIERLGVPPDRIECVGGCTSENRGLASYRRDRAAAGRQWSMVFLDL